MASNIDAHGKNVFDVGKRIRQSVGDDFATNTELNSFNRLNEASNGGGIRSNKETSSFGKEDTVNLTSKIVHTNPIKPNAVKDDEENMNTIPYSEIQTKFTNTLVYRGNKQFVKLITGINPGGSTDSIIDGSLAFATRVVTDAACRKSIDKFVLNTDKNFGNKIKSVAAISGVNTAVNTLLAVNHDEFDKIFDSENIPNKYKSYASRVAYAESIKYNVLRSASVTVAPVVIKSTIDKFVPVSVKDNFIYKVATNFNLLSTISGFLFGKINTTSVMNYAVKMDKYLSENNVSDKEYIKIMAKSASKLMMSNSYDPDLITSSVFTLSDITSQALGCLKNKKSKTITEKVIKDHTNNEQVKISPMVSKVKPVKTVSKSKKIDK